ncbi:MAG TPA: nitroreductase family protein [Myxococcota bacterium]|nr:nitroreductase family protein [Myxococcota bacterium]
MPESKLEAIFSRRSIRKFTNQPIDDDRIELLLEAAMVAPSARDTRSWQFVVIRDRELLSKVPEVHPYASMVPEAALAILVCADTRLESIEGYWAINCATACENILLQAQHMGLGAVWLGVYPRKERIDSLRKLCAVPEPVVPFALLAIGYPAEHKPPAERYDQARIHQNRYSPCA